MKTRILIVGYGNLGRAAIENLRHFPDMELVGVVSRRKLNGIDCPVFSFDELDKLKDKVDVALMCGGSATDLPVQSPAFAKLFNIVDSFDTHAKIPQHYADVEGAAKAAKTLAAISIGWDPGLFSIMRVMFESILPKGESYTFWGKGVSQGHSDALRRITGVKKAVQYTIPKDEAVQKVRSGSNPALSTAEKHLRECFIVAEKSEHERIRNEVVNMPNYFLGYDTVVHFISDTEFDSNHTSLPHGGFVLRSGETGKNAQNLLELSIKLESNPLFTSSIMLCFARAVARLHSEGKCGAVTIFDVPVGYLSAFSPSDLRKNCL